MSRICTFLFLVLYHTCDSFMPSPVMTVIDHTDINVAHGVSFTVHVVPSERISQIVYNSSVRKLVSTLFACCSVWHVIDGPVDFEVCRPIAEFRAHNESFTSNFVFPHLSSHVIWIHSWIAVFGDSGHIRESDSYFVVDKRVQNITPIFESYWGTITLDIDHLHTQPSPVCVQDRLLYNYNLTSLGSWPIQTSFNLFCSQMQLHHCFNALSQVINYLYKRLLSMKGSGLPQYVNTIPTPGAPFLFFHIDKCAGTYLRE